MRVKMRSVQARYGVVHRYGVVQSQISVHIHASPASPSPRPSLPPSLPASLPVSQGCIFYEMMTMEFLWQRRGMLGVSVSPNPKSPILAVMSNP